MFLRMIRLRHDDLSGGVAMNSIVHLALDGPDFDPLFLSILGKDEKINCAVANSQIVSRYCISPSLLYSIAHLAPGWNPCLLILSRY